MFRQKIGAISFSVLLLALVGSGVESAIVQPTSATAVFNSNGVTGWVRFFHSEPEPLADIIVNLQGLTEAADWSIHELPVDETLSPVDRCSEAYLGGVYNPTNEQVVNNSDCGNNPSACPVGDLSGRLRQINAEGVDWFNETANLIMLQGSQSIIGRSLLLVVGSRRICSTIRSKKAGDVTTLQATFISPVAGTIYFRQSGNEPSVIHGKLFRVNDMAAASPAEWGIYDDLLDETYRAGDCGNPTMTSDSGSLASRHGGISISNSPLPYSENAFLFTDDILKLSEINGRSLILRQGGSVIACAPIVISESIETFQYPKFDVQIGQSSPYENSTLTLTAGFKASTYTILSAAWMTSGLCPLADEIYNPLSVTAPGDDVPFRTPDMFEYGNITGKFGSLLGPSQTLDLFELPMYGAFSMLGLTLRAVSKNPTTPYRICSALVPLKDEYTLLAKATFTEGSVRGAIYFLQRQDPEFSGQPGVTNIIVDLYLNNSTMSKSSRWNIQATPAEGSTCSTSADSSYNPFSVVRGADYTNECTIKSPLRCESGDLSGKHGDLIIPHLGPQRGTSAFIDSNLQLDQTYKIIGQSVALYSTLDSSLLGCAEIQIVKPSDPEYDVVVAFPENAVFERVAFAKNLVEMASLADKVDPSDLLILHEEVGTIASENPATTCATTQLKLTASSVGEANSYAVALQRSVCDKFANNGCMTQLPDYDRLCARAGAAAQAVISGLSAMLTIATLAMLALF